MRIVSAILLLTGVALEAAGASHRLTFQSRLGMREDEQSLCHDAFRLDQREPAAVSYAVRARGMGLGPAVTPNARKFGVELKIEYSDGSVKWLTPPKLLDPGRKDWQEVSGVFVPPRAVSRVVFYCRLATDGAAEFDGISVEALPADVSHGDCSVTERDGLVTLENDFLRLTLNPSAGGTGVSLTANKSGIEYATSKDRYGLFMDRFRTGGDCTKRAYAATVVADSPDEAEVALKVTGPAGLQFLEIEKHFRLTRDSGGLEVRYVYRNLPASMGELVIEPWFKNGVLPRGAKEQLHFLPTATGVKSYGVSLGDVYPEDVVAGWVAVGDGTAHAMAVEFDYAHLAKSYLWLGGTDRTVAEWGFQPVAVAAGETFETPLLFYPADGLGKPDGCANGIAAEFAAQDDVAVVRLASARTHVLRAELAVRHVDGSQRKAMKFMKVGPDGVVSWRSGLSAKDVALTVLRLYDGESLVLEAVRSADKDFVYRPKIVKARPAEVKPFVLSLKDSVKSDAAVLAKPWSGGRIRVLFLTDLALQRENVELMERMDMEARTVRIAYSADRNTWGMVERFNTFSLEDSNLSIRHELARSPDAILVSGRIWDRVDAVNRAKIAELVKSGKTGLVTIGNKAALPKGLSEDADGSAYVTQAIDKGLLPFGGDRLRAFSQGGSRFVLCDWDGIDGLVPFVQPETPEPVFGRHDYSLAAIARALVWASKRDLPRREGLKRTEEWVEPHPKLRIAHVRYLDEKGVVDFECRLVSKETAASLLSLEVDPITVPENGAVKGSLNATAGTARVTLEDGFGRILSVADNVTGAFALATEGARTTVLKVKAELFRDGALCDRKVADACVRLPRSDPDFTFSTGTETSIRGGKHYLREVYLREARKLGVTHVRFWQMPPSEVSREYARFGFGLNYPIADLRIGQWRFPKEFGEPYAATKDKKYLVRKPCFHDPDFVAADMKRIGRNLDAALKFSPDSVDCGDETTLTMWATPFDFCFGEHTLRAFREWLKGEYGDLATLNRAWGTDFSAWDAVMPDTTEEARARPKRTGRRAYGAWADHRRFMELAFCGHVAKIKSIIDERCPGLPLDMSGTQQPNGWTGMDMWLVGQSIGIPSAYDECCLAEIVRSFGRPLVKPWYGYGCGQHQGYRVWRDAFRFRNFGLSFFSGGNLLMPDYTVPTPVQELVSSLADLRAGGQRLLRSLETVPEALVHYSQASIHAAQIEKRYDAFIAARERAVKALDAGGTPYRFVAYAEIENGELERTAAKTLYLPQSSALSSKEVAAIRAFACRGGKVYGDEVSGIMDQHCRFLGKSPLADVVVTDWKFAPDPGDGIQVFRYRSRLGLDGDYFGFVRAPGAKGTGVRTIPLGKNAWVYDMRAKTCQGRTCSFDVSLAPGEAAFYAALPYEVKSLSLSLPKSIRAGERMELSCRLVADGEIRALHPVRFEVFAPAGDKGEPYSGLTEMRNGCCVHRFKTALNDPQGLWRVRATDFVSGLSAYGEFQVADPNAVNLSAQCRISRGVARSASNENRRMVLRSPVAERLAPLKFSASSTVPGHDQNE